MVPPSGSRKVTVVWVVVAGCLEAVIRVVVAGLQVVAAKWMKSVVQALAVHAHYVVITGQCLEGGDDVLQIIHFETSVVSSMHLERMRRRSRPT